MNLNIMKTNNIINFDIIGNKDYNLNEVFNITTERIDELGDLIQPVMNTIFKEVKTDLKNQLLSGEEKSFKVDNNVCLKAIKDIEVNNEQELAVVIAICYKAQMRLQETIADIIEQASEILEIVGLDKLKKIIAEAK